MTNLPPGCSPSSIPGNRPEDIERENLDERLLGALKDMYNEDLARLVTFLEDMHPREIMAMVDGMERRFNDRVAEEEKARTRKVGEPE